MPRRSASPPRPLTEADFLAAILARWPTLTIVPGAAAIEDPTSDLAKLRDNCDLTASRAGVLWNCKRGQSRSAYLDEKSGRRPPVPPNDWVRSLMDAGREWEPKIQSMFSLTMAAEFKRVFGGPFGAWLPGPFAEEGTSATPDGLHTFRIGGVWYMLPFEIKFFASKTVLPLDLPHDYLAQVLMQMAHAQSLLSLLVGACVCDGTTSYRIWKIQATPAHIADYRNRLALLRRDLARGKWPKRNANEGAELESLVVGSTDDCTDVWEFIAANRELLPHLNRVNTGLRTAT
jgi:YqaJ-like viral recombinase domain